MRLGKPAFSGTSLSLSLFLVLSFAWAYLPVPARCGRIVETRLTTGFDSFINRYTILENDTTEALNEFYLRLFNRIYKGNARKQPLLSNMLKIGDQSVDDRLDLDLHLGDPNSFGTQFSGTAYIKHFHEKSDYPLSNDYRQYNSTLKLGLKLAEGLSLNSRSRAELVDYDERTDFDYDYHYLETGVELYGGDILENLFRLSAALGTSEAPDTAQLGFNRRLLEADAYLSASSGFRWDLNLVADRRSYRGSSRSSYWMMIYHSGLKISSNEKLEYSVNFEGEHLIYDSQTQTYFDTHFLRGSAGASVGFEGKGTLRIQPRLARLLCPDLAEERYQEITVLAEYEILTGKGYWFSISYEPGTRNYLDESEGVYSDFYIHRISAMAGITIASGITADLFLIHDPEYHSRREDDFSITMISVSLSRNF